MNDAKNIRVLVAKPGLDGHERGAWVVAYGLRDAGFEVIYTGLRQTPEEIAKAAVQEDVDVIGLSVLSGAHLSLTTELKDKLKEYGGEDIKIIIGGLIPEKDHQKLNNLGISGIFTAGSSIDSISEFIRNNL